MTRARTCLVTGASRGIGAAVAARLAADGHRVALLGRDVDAVNAVAATLPSSLAVSADVTDPEQTAAAFDRIEREWGPVEVLVSNAGSGAAAPLAETSDELWGQMIELNLTAPFRLIRRAVPAMVAGGWGRIIVVASVVAKRGEAQVTAYSAAKHGALGLVRASAAELARTGVTVNAVCPGYVDTPMTDESVANIASGTGRSEEDARAILEGAQPIGRLITTQEVASAVMLCVDNGGINGQGLNVDGGSVQS